MAYQFVMVNLSITSLDGSTGQVGSLHFEVNDFVLDVVTGAILIVPPIDLEANGAFIGNPVQVPMLAMDDPSLSHNWAWLLSAELVGVRDFPTRKFTVNFAAGAVQDFKDLAINSTIV